MSNKRYSLEQFIQSRIEVENQPSSDNRQTSRWYEYCRITVLIRIDEVK